MKLLLENWREYITEAAKTAEELPEGVVVAVHEIGNDTKGGKK